MLNQEFKNSILQTLKQDSSLWTRGALNESEFLDKVINLDKNVLDLLLTNEIVKNKFFKNINSKITIFNKDSFILFWQENQTFNSYTRFLNKIGLGYKTNNRFVADNSEVVLNFPFKDCVLKGDQSEEDIKNNNEIFYHEVIAQDEIDRLFEEKALDNFQKIDKIGRHSLSAIKSPPPITV
ncbi:MAG: site-specific DNA-methyltransferase [Thaumarchaeota archaeon]|nr:site-specific DNA-methyltransferase [Nitrososphaerota archaeon]